MPPKLSYKRKPRNPRLPSPWANLHCYVPQPQSIQESPNGPILTCNIRLKNHTNTNPSHYIHQSDTCVPSHTLYLYIHHAQRQSSCIIRHTQHHVDHVHVIHHVDHVHVIHHMYTRSCYRRALKTLQHLLNTTCSYAYSCEDLV